MFGVANAQIPMVNIWDGKKLIELWKISGLLTEI